MNNLHYVIIGNGASANNAAKTIRNGDNACKITLISNESFPFYYRHLLCSFTVGDKKEEELIVHSPSFYKKNNIKVRLGQSVASIDFNQKTIYLKHMEKVQYDKLLLCVGGVPDTPPLYRSFKHHFFYLKTLAHARNLQEKLIHTKQVLLVGGDLISLRLAETLLAKGIQVTMLLDKHSFWPLEHELTQEVRVELSQYLSAKGVHVLKDDSLFHVSKSATQGYDIKTCNDQHIRADLVGSFFGLLPDLDFLRGSGLDIAQGILVNEFLQTNIPDVFASGDCAQVYNPKINNYWQSIGWPNAERLGEIAANNMLGKHIMSEEPRRYTLCFDETTIKTYWWKKL